MHVDRAVKTTLAFRLWYHNAEDTRAGSAVLVVVEHICAAVRIMLSCAASVWLQEVSVCCDVTCAHVATSSL